MIEPSSPISQRIRTALRSTAAVLVVLLSLISTSIPAVAQTSERRSFIVRSLPGTELKELREQVGSLLTDVPVLTVQAVVSSSGSSRELLSRNGLDRYFVVDVQSNESEDLLEELRRIPSVDLVFPNHTYTVHNAEPNDPEYPEQWALKTLEALKAWDITEGVPSVRVGVIDTGIEWDHPDLVRNIWINEDEDLNGNGRFDPWSSGESRDGVTGDLDGIDQDGNGFADDVIGYDFVDQDVPNVGDWAGWDPIPSDDEGHGTSVAGVIAATRNNGIGIVGIAPGVRVVAIRAFDGTGNGQDDDIAAAIVYAADRGVSVLNMSFGDFYRSPLMYDAIRYAYDKGVLLVGSSGNDGVSDPHYPSAFSEVMSIGATNEEDLVSPFSTFGSQLTMTAPGVGIRTTTIGGDYRTVDGTSFAAPYVAGVGALLRALHPDWTVDEVWAALEMTADDQGTPGWDKNYGSGRLNALAALDGPGPALLEITSPLTDDGVDKDEVVSVVGSALAPLLESWRLELGMGNLPDTWTAVDSSERGIANGVLGTFSTASLPDTLLLIRLTLNLTNGKSLERRTRFYLDRTPPDTVEFNLRNVWRLDGRALALTLRTDDPTRAVVIARPTGSGEPYRAFELEPEFVGLTTSHYFYLTNLELTAGVPYDLYVHLTNPAGGESTVGTPDQPLAAEIEERSFPLGGMRRTDWSLPYGFVLNDRLSLTVSDSSEFLMNRFADFSFEQLMLYRFEGDRFVPADSAGNWIPRGVGDSDGDGLKEVIGQSNRIGVVYEQTTPKGSPFASVMYRDTASKRFYPAAFYDFDNDGRDELVGYTSEDDESDQYYYVAAWNGSEYVEQARLPNVTLPPAGFSRNFMGASDVVIGDFNRNGKVDILFGDSDADFMLYERESQTEYRLIWADENEGTEGDRLIAAGDIDNDGIDELILGFGQSPLELDAAREHYPGLWRLKVVKPRNGGVQKMTEEEFTFVRPTSPFRAGLEVGDIDGRPGDEIAFSVFPNMYVLRWNDGEDRLEPLWRRGASLINRPVLQDFDNDGRNELGVGDGGEIAFYEYIGESSPSAPAGVQGWSVNDSTAFVRWEPVPGADRYRLYRSLDAGFPLITETTGTEFIDTGAGTANGRLLNGRLYTYVVTAVDDDAETVESPGGGPVAVFIHRQIGISDVEAADGRQIRLAFTGRVGERLYRNGALNVQVDGRSVVLSSVQPVAEESVLITTRKPVYGQTLVIRPTELFRDFYGSPVDTSVSILVEMPSEVIDSPFVAVHAVPLEGKRIAIDFSDAVDPATGLDPDNYEPDPDGVVVAVEPDPSDPTRVILTLDEGYPLGPYGYEYLVTVRGVRSSDGRSVGSGAGSVVGFTISARELDDLFVYPHPFSPERDGSVTFAGLPQGVLIRLYTASGSILREIEANRGDGGASWDGTDAQGRVVPPGIYLYSVVRSGPDGEEVESKLKKIAVAP